MRVLGLDPGLVRTGWALIESGHDRYNLESAGVIAPDPKAPLGERLAQGFANVNDVLSGMRPDLVVIEDLFAAPAHPKSALLMAHMRGVLCLAAEIARVPTCHLTATNVKQRLTGNGHASKDQVRRMVFQLCGEPPRRVRADLTDAVALAIAGANQGYAEATMSVLRR